MDDINNDSPKNDLRALLEGPMLEENHCNPNLLGSIVDREGNSPILNEDVSDYSHQNDDLKIFNEEAIPVVAVNNPVEACLSDILLRLRERFIYFDSTTKSFRKCVGSSLECAIAEQPDGAEGFSFEWYGIALSIVRDVLNQELRTKKELNTLRPLPITIYAARKSFISGLHLLTSHVTREWLRLCYPSSPGDSLPQIKSISKRILDDWVASHQLPDSMSSRYSSALSESPIDSLQDLEILLTADTGAWVASLFPPFHSLSQNTYTFINLIWLDKRVDQFDAEEFANQVYILCMQKSLLKNKDGLLRGIVVPRSWLTGLLDWLKQLLLHNEEERNMSSIPGPIDTFPFMKVDLHSPSRHWLLPEVKNSVDIIPERLFCFFSQIFGCGIKYTTYGDFTLRDQFIRVLKPTDLIIQVSFCWFQTVDGILEEKNVHVFVENALHRTDVTEVIRLAYQIIKKEEDAMSAVELQLWAAAVNRPTSLIVRAKHLNSEFLMPPLDIELHERGLTMSSLIKTMVEQLGEHQKFVPRQELSIGIELQLRSVKIQQDKNISYVVTPQTVKRCGLCGLTNVGNTCYMNSALQCLSNIPHFRDRILYFPVSHYTNAPLTSSVVDLLTEMWSGHSECVKTATLYSVISQEVKRFNGHQQQDACEFVEVLLDRMQEELNDVSERCYRERLDTDKNIPLVQLSDIFWNNFLENNTSFISQDFFHQSKTVFTCLTCEETSVVFDNNVTLSLSIRETKTQNVIVVVQKPPFGASSDDAKGYSVESILPNLEDQVVCISIDVHIMTYESSGTAEMNLKKAIRNALCECLELKKKMASNLPTAGHSTEEPIEFDYNVEILEVTNNGFAKVYAWARCVMRGVMEYSSNVSFAAVKPKEEINHQSLSRSGGYRIWYFLKCDDDDSQTAHDTLIYVDELPFSLSCTQDSFSKTDVAGEEEKNEALHLAQEGSLNSSSPVQAPFSNRILGLSRNIARSFLVPCSEESEGVSLSPAAVSDDQDDASVFSPLESQIKEHSAVSLKVMCNSSGKSLILDLNECSKTDGDNWLEELRTYDTVKVKRRKKHKSGIITCGGLSSIEKMTNISVFLCFTNDCFRAKVPQITMRSNTERSHSAYLRLSNHGEKCDSDPMCTLHDCFEQSMIPDTLTDDNSWYCPHCKDFREARLQRNIFRVPPWLIISFKALKMVNTYHADKNTTPIDFPLEFDFSPYLDVESAFLNQDTVYRLRGVVYHSGSLNFGHYTAYAFNDNLNKWVYFDDSRFCVMDVEKPPSIGAYMLFYERISRAKS